MRRPMEAVRLNHQPRMLISPAQTRQEKNEARARERLRTEVDIMLCYDGEHGSSSVSDGSWPGARRGPSPRLGFLLPQTPLACFCLCALGGFTALAVVSPCPRLRTSARTHARRKMKEARHERRGAPPSPESPEWSGQVASAGCMRSSRTRFPALWEPRSVA